MAIDTTPSTVATSALAAIPFSSLIGGPLDAAIKAQAMAAKTSWEFIDKVGLNVDKKTGEKSAINVKFQYQKDGQSVNLVVPLLTIVPIPYIAINTIDINFLANISASSSSVETASDTTTKTAGGSVSAGVSFDGFTASAKFKANYSSKKSSKATQDSKYSVEYTMDVVVNAGQDSMPAGLAAVLNILQGSITDANPNGELQVSPAATALDVKNPAVPATINAVLRDDSGKNLSGQVVTFAVTGSSPPFTPTIVTGTADSSSDEAEAASDGFPLKVKTNAQGQAGISILVDAKSVTSSTATSWPISVSAMPPNQKEITEPVALTLLNVPPKK